MPEPQMINIFNIEPLKDKSTQYLYNERINQKVLQRPVNKQDQRFENIKKQHIRPRYGSTGKETGKR